ncbi:MAG: class A beta-lactamase-related serine hydrolase [Acidobacteria bacterium]|nr:class A beta-lactamase-related serine hydrolase [Acidobacteriota bacterium]
MSKLRINRATPGGVRTALLLGAAFALCNFPPAAAQTRGGAAPAPARPARVAPVASPALQTLVDEAARGALRKFADKNLKESQLAVTVIDLRDAARPAWGSFRGEERIYPASVVKMFFLAAAHRLLEDGRLKMTDEFDRALRDMIVDSSNDATGFVLDVITGSTSGAELSPAELKRWQHKRDWVNRYFASLGYTNINTNQKTFCEDAYGREKQSRGANGVNRNKLTTNATARLLAEIVTGRAVTPARSAQMMELLKRDFAGKSGDPDDQAHGFTGIALGGAAGARLWSKAGWTSTTRHDAAYVELPNGARFVVVTYTEQQSNVRDIIPTVAKIVIDHFGGK